MEKKSKFEREFIAARQRVALKPVTDIPTAVADAPQTPTKAVPGKVAFPTGLLPVIMREAINAVVGIQGCPAELAGQAALASASHAVQGHYNVDTYKFGHRPISEFFFVISKSGSSKSTIWREFTGGYHRWLAEAIVVSDEMQRETAIDFENYKYDREAAIREKDSATRKRKLMNLVKPKRFPEARALLEKTTTVGVYKTIQRTIPSLAIMTDEGGQLLGSHSFKADKGAGAIEFVANLTKLWDGATVDRNTGDAQEYYSNRRMTVMIMAQEAVAKPFLSSALFAEQGIHARMLLADVPAYEREPIDLTSDVGRARDDRLRQKIKPFENRMYDLHRECQWEYCGEDFHVAPQIITMSYDARAWIQAWEHVVRIDVAKSGLSFFQRLLEHAMRLAAICAVVDGADEVGECHARAGTALVDYYAAQWAALDTSSAPDNAASEMRHVASVVKFIAANGGSATKRDLDNKGPIGYRTSDTAFKRRVLMAALDTEQLIETVAQNRNGTTTSMWSLV